MASIELNDESYRIEETNLWFDRGNPRGGKQLIDACICNWRHSGVAATTNERPCVAVRMVQADRKEPSQEGRPSM